MKKDTLDKTTTISPEALRGARTGAAVGLAVDPTPESGDKLKTLLVDIARLEKANAGYYARLTQKTGPLSFAESKWLAFYEKEQGRKRKEGETEWTAKHLVTA